MKALESNYEWLDNKLKQDISSNELVVLLNPQDLELIGSLLEKELMVGDTNKVNLSNNPTLQLANQEVDRAKNRESVRSAYNFPDITIGYFIQSIKGEQIENGAPVIYDGTPRFQGVNIGLSIPLFYGSNKAERAAAKTDVLIEEQQADYVLKQLENQLLRATRELMLQNMQVNFYAKALENANLLIEKSTLGYANGDIDYLQYAQAITSSFNTQKKYLSAVKAYNESVYRVKYLVNSL